MPRNRFIRFFTGDSLASKLSDEEFRKSNPSLFDLAKFHEISLTESGAKSAYDPGELDNTLGREVSYRINPLNGKPFFLLDIPVDKRKEKLRELSDNPAVIEQLFNIVSTGAGLEIDSLNEGLVKNTSPTLVAQHSKALNFQTIQCEADGSILVTSTTGRKIATADTSEGGNGVVLAENLKFYISTVALRISPKEVKSGEPERAIITVEYVKEEVNLGVLEDTKNTYMRNLGEKNYKEVLNTKSSHVQKQKQKKINDNLKHKALYIYAYNSLEQYTKNNDFKDLALDIKKHVFGKLDKDKFKESILALESFEKEEISELLKEFNTLQLTKIKTAVLQVCPENQKVIEQIIKLLKDRADVKRIHNYLINIKRCLSYSYFSGANISLFFSRNHELKKIIENFAEIEMTERSQAVIQGSVYYPIIKNALLSFFNSYELCELYKKLTNISTDKINAENVKNKAEVLKQIIGFILVERNIETTYYKQKGEDTTSPKVGSPNSSDDCHPAQLSF